MPGCACSRRARRSCDEIDTKRVRRSPHEVIDASTHRDRFGLITCAPCGSQSVTQVEHSRREAGGGWHYSIAESESRMILSNAIALDVLLRQGLRTGRRGVTVVIDVALKICVQLLGNLSTLLRSEAG